SQDWTDVIGGWLAKYEQSNRYRAEGTAPVLPGVNLVKESGEALQAGGLGLLGAAGSATVGAAAQVTRGVGARLYEKSLKNAEIIRQSKKMMEAQKHNLAFMDKLIEMEGEHSSGDRITHYYVDAKQVVDEATKSGDLKGAL